MSTSWREGENRTEWNFEFRSEPDRLVDLDHATCGRIVDEALELEDEYGWKVLDEHLLACFA